MGILSNLFGSLFGKRSTKGTEEYLNEGRAKSNVKPSSSRNKRPKIGPPAPKPKVPNYYGRIPAPPPKPRYERYDRHVHTSHHDSDDGLMEGIITGAAAASIMGSISHGSDNTTTDTPTFGGGDFGGGGASGEWDSGNSDSDSSSDSSPSSED